MGSNMEGIYDRPTGRPADEVLEIPAVRISRYPRGDRTIRVEITIPSVGSFRASIASFERGARTIKWDDDTGLANVPAGLPTLYDTVWDAVDVFERKYGAMVW